MCKTNWRSAVVNSTSSYEFKASRWLEKGCTEHTVYSFKAWHDDFNFYITHFPFPKSNILSSSALTNLSHVLYDMPGHAPLMIVSFWGPLDVLGIEFYLFVSHGGMNDRGSTCKFHFRNLHVDPLSFIPPFNPYIYSILIFILYQNCPVLAMKFPFFNTQKGGIQNSHRNSQLIRHGNGFMEEWVSKFFLCS